MSVKSQEYLQGRAKFPTGGKVRERKLNRCDSGTDSTVWMEEDASRKVCGVCGSLRARCINGSA